MTNSELKAALAARDAEVLGMREKQEKLRQQLEELKEARLKGKENEASGQERPAPTPQQVGS